MHKFYQNYYCLIEYAWYICYISEMAGLYHLKTHVILLHVIINISKKLVQLINIVVINCVTYFPEPPSEIQYSLESCLGAR